MAMFGTTQGNIDVPAPSEPIVGAVPGAMTGPGQGERIKPVATQTGTPNSQPIK